MPERYAKFIDAAGKYMAGLPWDDDDDMNEAWFAAADALIAVCSELFRGYADHGRIAYDMQCSYDRHEKKGD